jgi:hypothetical protein
MGDLDDAKYRARAIPPGAGDAETIRAGKSKQVKRSESNFSRRSLSSDRITTSIFSPPIWMPRLALSSLLVLNAAAAFATLGAVSSAVAQRPVIIVNKKKQRMFFVNRFGSIFGTEFREPTSYKKSPDRLLLLGLSVISVF